MMNTCSNCQTQFEGNFCPNCGSPAVTPVQEPLANNAPVVSEKKKGVVSAVIRLLIMTICNVIAVGLLFYAPFQSSETMTFWEKIVDGVASCGMLMLLGTWFWVVIKWAIFATPKTFGFAKKIFETIIPLSSLALFLEVSIGAVIAFFPISIISLAYSPVLLLATYISEHRTNILVPLLVLVVAAAAVFFLGRLDFHKVFGKRKAASK